MFGRRQSFLGLAGGLAAAVALMKTAPADAMTLDRSPHSRTDGAKHRRAAKPEKHIGYVLGPPTSIHRRRFYRRYYYPARVISTIVRALLLPLVVGARRRSPAPKRVASRSPRATSHIPT